MFMHLVLMEKYSNILIICCCIFPYRHIYDWLSWYGASFWIGKKFLQNLCSKMVFLV